jgi:uncharacterized membrane protein YbhN (UPF0104 family)
MEGVRFSSLPARLPGLGRTVRLAVPPLLLAALVRDVGTDPFARSLHVLSPVPVLAALLLGGVTTVAQAMRWRTVATGGDPAPELTRGRAIRECYRSSLLNAVLPGGVMGDALRAWRHRAPRERGLRTSAQAVVGERVAGTAVLLGAVAVVTFPLERRVSLAFLAGALVATCVAAPSLRRLPVNRQLAVWGWSLLALVPLVALFGVATAALGTVRGLAGTVSLALIVLAGMAIPIGVGGFGPREAVAAVAFGSVGLNAHAGVTTAAAYGVLAAVSALPGALVMLLDLRSHPRQVRELRDMRVEVPVEVDVEIPADARELVVIDLVRREPALRAVHPARRREIQLDAGVLAEYEPAGRSA